MVIDYLLFLFLPLLIFLAVFVTRTFLLSGGLACWSDCERRRIYSSLKLLYVVLRLLNTSANTRVF